MTYGVYTKSLDAYSIREVSLETARRYLHSPNHVIASERKVCRGITIEFYWEKKWRFRIRRSELWIGPVALYFTKLYTTMPDKVVEEYKPNGAEPRQ